ncbi:MAG: nucleoside deaminase [Rhizobiales bacterium]|nr:nucleoside deaminase [Hyphomicrobiales bacterium]
MELAFREAEAAADRGEVPVGAVITGSGGAIISSAGNRTIELSDPTAHAELLAIRKACMVLQSSRLVDCDLYVTLEPCGMCATAISFARLRRVYFGALDAKMGAIESGPCLFNDASCHHAPEVYGGIGEARAKALLVEFFKQRR